MNKLFDVLFVKMALITVSCLSVQASEGRFVITGVYMGKHSLTQDGTNPLKFGDFVLGEEILHLDKNFCEGQEGKNLPIKIVRPGHPDQQLTGTVTLASHKKLCFDYLEKYDPSKPLDQYIQNYLSHQNLEDQMSFQWFYQIQAHNPFFQNGAKKAQLSICFSYKFPIKFAQKARISHVTAEDKDCLSRVFINYNGGFGALEGELDLLFFKHIETPLKTSKSWFKVDNEGDIRLVCSTMNALDPHHKLWIERNLQALEENEREGALLKNYPLWPKDQKSFDVITSDNRKNLKKKYWRMTQRTYAPSSHLWVNGQKGIQIALSSSEEWQECDKEGKDLGTTLTVQLIRITPYLLKGEAPSTIHDVEGNSLLQLMACTKNGSKIDQSWSIYKEGPTTHMDYTNGHGEYAYSIFDLEGARWKKSDAVYSLRDVLSAYAPLKTFHIPLKIKFKLGHLSLKHRKRGNDALTDLILNPIPGVSITFEGDELDFGFIDKNIHYIPQEGIESIKLEAYLGHVPQTRAIHLGGIKKKLDLTLRATHNQEFYKENNFIQALKHIPQLRKIILEENAHDMVNDEFLLTAANHTNLKEIHLKKFTVSAHPLDALSVKINGTIISKPWGDVLGKLRGLKELKIVPTVAYSPEKRNAAWSIIETLLKNNQQTIQYLSIGRTMTGPIAFDSYFSEAFGKFSTTLATLSKLKCLSILGDSLDNNQTVYLMKSLAKSGKPAIENLTITMPYTILPTLSSDTYNIANPDEWTALGMFKNVVAFPLLALDKFVLYPVLEVGKTVIGTDNDQYWDAARYIAQMKSLKSVNLNLCHAVPNYLWRQDYTMNWIHKNRDAKQPKLTIQFI